MPVLIQIHLFETFGLRKKVVMDNSSFPEEFYCTVQYNYIVQLLKLTFFGWPWIPNHTL